MKFEKRTIAIILVATIGLSLFVGLSSATSGKDPLSQILQILLGIEPKITNIESKINTIDAKMGLLNFTRILDYREGAGGALDGGYEQVVHVTASNPVLFTIYLNMYGHGEVIVLNDFNELAASVPGPGGAAAYVGIPFKTFPVNGDTDEINESNQIFTFLGDNVYIWAHADPLEDLGCLYKVIVEGNAGTVIT